MNTVDDVKVEVSIGGTATVLAKYAPVIALINSTENGDIWQEVVDSWVQMLRQMAVSADMEVDDLIAKVLAEAAEEAPSEVAE